MVGLLAPAAQLVGAHLEERLQLQPTSGHVAELSAGPRRAAGAAPVDSRKLYIYLELSSSAHT